MCHGILKTLIIVLVILCFVLGFSASDEAFAKPAINDPCEFLKGIKNKLIALGAVNANSREEALSFTFSRKTLAPGVLDFLVRKCIEDIAKIGAARLSTEPLPSIQPEGAAGQEIQVGDSPTALVFADLNGDQLLDLAVANNGSDDVSLILGQADGTFGIATNFAVGIGPVAVRTGDFNFDGIPDLVTANVGRFPAEGGVSLLLGNGASAFQPAVELSPGNSEGVEVADVNQDGRTDVVQAPQGLNAVHILLNNGDATFQAVRQVETSAPVSSLAIGDFNADSRLDIAAGIQSGLSILLGDGSGGFQLGQEFIFPSNGETLQTATGDFDLDGNLDVVTTNFDNSVAVVLNNGDGTFQEPVFYVVNDLPNALSVLDLDVDGFLDLVVSNFNAEHASVLLGQGDGTFHSSRGYAAGDRSGGASSITPADFNQDGFIDLAVAVGRNTLLFPGAEAGLLSAPLALEKRSEFVASGDFNQDALTDLALVRVQDETGVRRPGILILLGNGDGSFTDGQTIRFPGFDFQRGPIVSALINGDLFLDLLVLDRVANEMKFLAGNGDGTFQDPVRVPVGLNPVEIALGDLNGDGLQDATVALEGDLGLANGGVAVLLGTGDGSFLAPVEVLSGVQAGAIAIGDLNNDLLLDVVVNTASMFFEFDIAVLLGAGAGSFQAPVSLPQPDSFAFQGVRLTVVDFDADGNHDVLVTDANQRLSIYPGNGDGTFGEVVRGDIGPDARDIVVTDLDQDGKPDVALASSSLVVTILNRSTDDDSAPPLPPGP